MSKQNLHIMPTLNQLLDYKKGNLTQEESLWVSQCLEQNAMLKGVFDHIEYIPLNDVEILTNKSRQKIPTFSEPVSKTSSIWNIKTISAFSIILLVCIGAIILHINFKNSDSEIITSSLHENFDYSFEDLYHLKDKEDYNEPHKEEAINIIDTISTKKSSLVEAKTTEKINPKKNNIHPVESQNKIQAEHKVIEEIKVEDIEIIKKEPIIKEVKTTDIKEVKINETKTISQNKIVVTDIKITKKLSLAEEKDKERKSSSPFLQTSPIKKSNSKSKPDDLPTFKGGDIALLDYIKGKLGLTHVAVDEDYSNKLILTFIVNNKGNIDDWQFFGHVAPEINKKVSKIMNEMPTWNKGKALGKKGQASYSIIISF